MCGVVWSLITSNVKSMLLLCSKLVELQLSTNGCTLVLLNHFLFILLVFISFFVLVLRYCVVPSSRFRKVLYLEVFLSLQGKLWNLVLAFLIVSMAVSQFLWGLLGFVESNLFTRQSPLMLLENQQSPTQLALRTLCASCWKPELLWISIKS